MALVEPAAPKSAAKQVNFQLPNEDVKAKQDDDADGSEEDSSDDDDSENSGDEEVLLSIYTSSICYRILLRLSDMLIKPIDSGTRVILSMFVTSIFAFSHEPLITYCVLAHSHISLILIMAALFQEEKVTAESDSEEDDSSDDEEDDSSEEETPKKVT